MDLKSIPKVAPLAVAALALAAALLAGCADDTDDPAPDGAVGEGNAENDDVFRVGLLNPLTGPFTALGEDVNDGFRMYVDVHGEIAGRTVEVYVEDEANDAAAATEAAERLVERNEVDVIVGFVNSGVAYGAAAYIAEAGVPLLISVAGADDLTQRDAVDNVFRLSYTGSMDAMPGGAYACDELGYETAAVIGLDYAFGWEGVGGFARAYEDAGCDVVQEVYVPLDTQDWAPFVQQLDTSADAVWVLNAGPDAIRFLQAYRDFGVPMPLIGHGSATDEEVLEQQESLAEGVVTTLHYSRMIETAENTEFVEQFEEAFGRTVSRYAEAGWSAGLVLEEALAGIDDIDYESLSAAIGEVEVDAPRGPISFDDYGQAVYNVYVREVREVDDGFQNVVIDTFEETSQFWTYDPDEYLALPPYAELKDTWAR